MQKVVFFDIDGTLLNTKKVIPESTINTIRRLKENDVIVAVATGRTPIELQKIVKELEIDSFVSCNGAYCVHNGEVFFKQPLEVNVVDKFTTFANENGHSVVLQTENEIRALSHSEHLKNTLAELSMEIPEIDVDFHKKRWIYQALLFSEVDFDNTYKNQFPELECIRFHKLGSDVLPSGMSKAKGVEHFVNLLGYDMDNVYAIGDGLNDKELLQKVGHGVAMGNVIDELKMVADFVTKHVDEDGIEYAFEKLGLI